MKLLLSIRSLNMGGAERQFIELVKHIDKIKFDILVVTMYGGVQEDIVKNIEHIKYINLNKKGRYDLFDFYKRYKKVLKEFQPDVTYSFLGEMNLFSLWCKSKKTKVVWGFRSSHRNVKKDGKVSYMVFLLQKYYSKKVDKIITNSNASIEFHNNNGFYMKKSIVISNGIDTFRFKRDKYKREKFRKQYNLKESDIAIGIVARIEYIKGYLIFTRAIKMILEDFENIKIFSVGGGNKSIKQECEEVLGKYNNDRFIWLENQKDIEDIYSGLDIYTSSSLGEGFSNSIAESMSCEVPCVVTDVGDSKIIVDDIGIVVNSNDENSLYDGLVKMVQSDYENLGRKSRNRIVENFSIKTMVEKTQKEIEKCME